MMVGPCKEGRRKSLLCTLTVVLQGLSLGDSVSLSVTEFPVQKKKRFMSRNHTKDYDFYWGSCHYLPDPASLISFVWKNWAITLLAAQLFAIGMLVLLIISTALQRLGSFQCYSDHPIFVTMISLMIKWLHLVSMIVRSYDLHCYREANSVITSPSVSLSLQSHHWVSQGYWSSSHLHNFLALVNEVDSGLPHLPWLDGSHSSVHAFLKLWYTFLPWSLSFPLAAGHCLFQTVRDILAVC